MTTVVDGPSSSRGEWHFRLFGVPVRVHPWFWVTTVFLGMNQDVGVVLIWIAVCFVSILLHEFGHIVAYRLFGERGEILLYSWGGLAISDREGRRRPFAQICISVAGPLAGFCLAALTVGFALAAGAKVHMGLSAWLFPSLTATLPAPSEEASYSHYYYASVLLHDLLFVNFYWGLINLLPVYPLDGGQASRAIFEQFDAVRGQRRSLYLSAAAAATIALMGLASHSLYMMVMFGMLAIGSVQTLEAYRPIYRQGPYRPR
jgi:stage IV sporulation protein FB